MDIHFRYQPDVCRFWLGVKQRYEGGERYKEFGLQSWMTVDDVIHILKTYENELIDEYSQ